MYFVSAPAKSGYRKEFKSIEQARACAAELLGVTMEDMVEVESPDGGLTYCYSSQTEADADYDGRHAEKAVAYGKADE